MISPEYLVIDEDNLNVFTQKLNEATENGFKVVSSSPFYIRHDFNGHTHYETFYYCLMIKNPVGNIGDFQFKILDELNEIKNELKELADNIKYLGE